MTDIPLFLLNVVLMPGTPLPLHIFEERYKQMVDECLESGAEFGMVLADESGTRRWVARRRSSSSCNVTTTAGW